MQGNMPGYLVEPNAPLFAKIIKNTTSDRKKD